MWFGGTSSYVRSEMRLDDEAVDRFFLIHRVVNHRDSPLNGLAMGDPARMAVLEALEAFRMAATNLPRDDKLIKSTHERLVAEVIPEVRGLERFLNLSAQAEADRRDKLGRPVSDPFDASQMDKMHLVSHGLYVGSYHPACELDTLRAHNVTHVLCCIEMAPKFPADLVYLVLGADDRVGYNIMQHLEETFMFIERAILDGGGVLVHCGAGISRAPTVAAAYLVRKLGVGADEAISHVKRARACVMPNMGFKSQLKEYAEGIKRKNNGGDPKPAPGAAATPPNPLRAPPPVPPVPSPALPAASPSVAPRPPHVTVTTTTRAPAGAPDVTVTTTTSTRAPAVASASVSREPTPTPPCSPTSDPDHSEGSTAFGGLSRRDSDLSIAEAVRRVAANSTQQSPTGTAHTESGDNTGSRTWWPGPVAVPVDDHLAASNSAPKLSDRSDQQLTEASSGPSRGVPQ